MADFFLQNMIHVYFFYGLSFYTLGMAIFLERGHSTDLPFIQAVKPLALFGLIHGSHEWFEMFFIIHRQSQSNPIPDWISGIALLVLFISFLLLIWFGLNLILDQTKHKYIISILSGFTLAWLIIVASLFIRLGFGNASIVTADVLTRYTIAIPGGLLTCLGLIRQNKRFASSGYLNFSFDVAMAAVAFGVYGAVGQLFVSPSAVFPSNILNVESFLAWFGFPIQVLRAAMACMAAVFIVRSLRTIKVENTRKIAALRQVEEDQRKRLSILQAELLHRAVKAQEDERQRIALELHDVTGQTLTALSMGLRGVSETVLTNQQKASQQAEQLELLAVDGIKELQQMVSGLRPPQLDDLGLVAALRWYTQEISHKFNLPIELKLDDNLPVLNPEKRISLFRIAQEALTNTVRHANAQRASVTLHKENDTLQLIIEDDGCGFDTSTFSSYSPEINFLGLAGMQERAALIGGKLIVLSNPDRGTRIQVILPLLGETLNVENSIAVS